MAKKMSRKFNQQTILKKARRNVSLQKRQCRFEANPELAATIDYKNIALLKTFTTERGKILSSRVSGISAFYQRRIAQAIKQARTMALLPFAAHH